MKVKPTKLIAVALLAIGSHLTMAQSQTSTLVSVPVQKTQVVKQEGKYYPPKDQKTVSVNQQQKNIDVVQKHDATPSVPSNYKHIIGPNATAVTQSPTIAELQLQKKQAMDKGESAKQYDDAINKINSNLSK